MITKGEKLERFPSRFQLKPNADSVFPSTPNLTEREREREGRGSLRKFVDGNGGVQDLKGWISGGWRESRPVMRHTRLDAA